MGYIFVAIALLSGARKGYCGKKTSGSVSEYRDAMLVNTVRMIFCILIGFSLLALQGNLRLLAVDAKTLLITALSGVMTSVFVVSWLLAVKKGAYMMLDVFLMLGVLVTLLLSFAVFREPIRLNQWAGMGVLLVAVIIMCSYNNSIKEKMSVMSFIILLICGIANGLTDFSQKLFTHIIDGGNAAVFNFYTYIFSALTLAVCYAAAGHGNKAPGRGGRILKEIFWYVLVMSVCLFMNSFFKTKAATYLTSAQLYPLNQGCGLMLSSVMAALFFKEKLTAKCVIGLITAFAGLLIINLL